MRGFWRAGIVLILLAGLIRAGVSGDAPGHATSRPLQPLIDAATPGSTLPLAPGHYTGPALIDKPLTIEGGGEVTISGGEQGTVIAVTGAGVTLRGLRITASGESHDAMDAGLVVSGRNHLIEDNTLDDVLFGIHLRQASDSTVRRNRVHGKDLGLGLRGDALRVWNGHGNLIADNRFERARDLTFANAPDNRVIGNRFENGRYGLHAIFSPRLLIERNAITHTGTGIVILYSPDEIVRGNRVAHALDGGGAGILFKESDAALVEDNEVIHCSVGLKVDAPPEPNGVLDVRGNRFAHNITGLFFYGEAGGHRFVGNRFESNLVTVGISGQGAGANNLWQGNFWDEYQGFDRNGDGVGDSPHEQWLYADRIWMETPQATFWRNSPVLELLDFLERLAPFAHPYRVLADAQPRMQ